MKKLSHFDRLRLRQAIADSARADYRRPAHLQREEQYSASKRGKRAADIKAVKAGRKYSPETGIYFAAKSRRGEAYDIDEDFRRKPGEFYGWKHGRAVYGKSRPPSPTGHLIKKERQLRGFKR